MNNAVNPADFRVALLRPKTESDYMEPAEPLGIEALAAALAGAGIPCRLFDREIDPAATVLRQILDYQPHLIGLSVMTQDNLQDALRMLLRLRAAMPGLACVVGGLYVTLNGERARAQFPADCHFLAGEGEVSLPRLCFSLMGIETPEPDKPFLDPPQWPWMVRPRLQEYLDMGAPINMRTSRGCPGQCNFCATPSLPPPLGTWHARSVQQVADEMEALCAHHHPHAFNFVDDDFGPLSRVEALVDELARRGLRCALSLQLRAPALYNRPNLAPLLQKLHKGGLCRVFIGLESFDEETLAWFGKRLDPARAVAAFQAVQNAGIAIHIGYILWHGRSTLQTVRAEATRLREAGFFTTKIVMAKLQLFPGCGLHKLHKNTGLALPLEHEFDRISALIAPLYDAWLVGALDVPRQHCLAWLEHGGEAAARVKRIDAELDKLDALSFAALMDPDSADEGEIAQAARAGKEALHAIGCTFDRTG